MRETGKLFLNFPPESDPSKAEDFGFGPPQADKIGNLKSQVPLTDIQR